MNRECEVWLDEYHLFPGADLKKTLEENIERVDYVLILITKKTFSEGIKFESIKALEEEIKGS